MKIGRFTLSAASLALLVFQLAIVSTIAAKYWYQRWTCPRVWTRAAAIDPQLPMRGRYLALELTVDGCQSTLPSAKNANFPRDVNGAVTPGSYVLRPNAVDFHANLKVVNNTFVAVRIEGTDDMTAGEEVVGSSHRRPISLSPIRRKARCRSSPARNFGSKSPFRPKARRAQHNWPSKTTERGSRWI
jgi:hypothetical protein